MIFLSPKLALSIFLTMGASIFAHALPGKQASNPLQLRSSLSLKSLESRPLPNSGLKQKLLSTQMPEENRPTGLQSPKVDSLSGGGSDGGNFAFYYTSGTYYRSIKLTLSRLIENHPVSELQVLEEKYNTQIDWKKFSDIVKNAKAAPTKQAERKNPDGYVEPLIMDYDPSSQSIIALEPFFRLFDKEVLSDKDVEQIKILILHEASHLFGVGVDDNDKESRAFSWDLLRLLYRYEYRCHYEKESPLECTYAPLLRNSISGEVKQIVLVSKVLLKNGKAEEKRACSAEANFWRPTYGKDFVKLSSVFFKTLESKTHSSFVNVDQMSSGDLVVIELYCSNTTHFFGSSKQASISVDFQDQDQNSILPPKLFLLDEGTWSGKIQFIRTDDGKLKPGK